MFLFARRSGMILTLLAALAAALATLAGCGGGGGGGDSGGGGTTTGSTTGTTTGSTTGTTTGSTTGTTTGTTTGSTSYTIVGTLQDTITHQVLTRRVVTVVGSPALTATTNSSGIFTIPNVIATSTFRLKVQEPAPSTFVDGFINVNPAAFPGNPKNIGVYTFDLSTNPPPPPLGS